VYTELPDGEDKLIGDAIGDFPQELVLVFGRKEL